MKHFLKLFDLHLKHEKKKKDGTGSLERTRQMFFFSIVELLLLHTMSVACRSVVM